MEETKNITIVLSLGNIFFEKDLVIEMEEMEGLPVTLGESFNPWPCFSKVYVEDVRPFLSELGKQELRAAMYRDGSKFRFDKWLRKILPEKVYTKNVEIYTCIHCKHTHVIFHLGEKKSFVTIVQILIKILSLFSWKFIVGSGLIGFIIYLFNVLSRPEFIKALMALFLITLILFLPPWLTKRS